MPRYIIRLEKDGRPFYLEWSTVVDAPVTKGLSYEEFVNQYQGKDLQERMARVDKKGTSSLLDDDVHSQILFNRAGPGECILSPDEIVRFYCLDEGINEKHPCWEARLNAFRQLVESKGGCDYDDIKNIIKSHPYE